MLCYLFVTLGPERMAKLLGAVAWYTKDGWRGEHWRYVDAALRLAERVVHSC